MKWTLILCIMALLAVWSYMGFPLSFSEAILNATLKDFALLKNDKIDLRIIVAGDWEMVCSSDGYGSPVHIKKFNKSFYAIGDSDDNRWGLIFIFSDGAYKGLTGRGTGVGLSGCVKKNDAVFYKKDRSYILSAAAQERMLQASKNGEWQMW